MIRPNFVIDKRTIRAQQITAMLMHIVDKHVDWNVQVLLNPDAQRDLCRELQDQLWCDGAQLITEGDRIAAGLPPRGTMGLTVDELRAIEMRQIISMTRPMPTVILSKEDADQQSG
jgi:hypothetical protein